MKKLVLGVLVISLPVYAIDFNVGIVGHAGVAHSQLATNEQVAFKSNEWVFQLGLGLTLWMMDNVGIQTGVQYAWYNYDYAHIPYGGKWDCRNLLVPIDLVYGIRMGNNKIVIGGGLVVCKQLAATGSVGTFCPAEIEDSLLTINVGPELLVGMELQGGRIVLHPSFKYAYGLDGVNDKFPTIDGDVPKHYFLLGLTIYYGL